MTRRCAALRSSTRVPCGAPAARVPCAAASHSRGPSRPACGAEGTPATFETPDAAGFTPGSVHSGATWAPSSVGGGAASVAGSAVSSARPGTKGLSLDGFLSKYTSEDNDSFEDLLEETNRKNRQRHAWCGRRCCPRGRAALAHGGRGVGRLYKKVVEQRQQLALDEGTTALKKKANEEGMHMAIEGWQYTPKNSLMYFPEGPSEGAADAITKAKKPRLISHAATRLQSGVAGSSSGAGAAEPTPDLGEGAGPTVNGYGFVVTPSPMPGVDADPTMTWGFIDGTPFRLDGGGTPAAKGPAGPLFAIQPPCAREEAGRQMAAAAAAKKRGGSTPRGRTPKRSAGQGTPAELRLASMSPAARQLGQRLVRGGRANSGLREAYGGTPRSSSSQSRTPVVTPRARAAALTPRPAAKPSATPDASTLTDGLL